MWVDMTRAHISRLHTGKRIFLFTAALLWLFGTPAYAQLIGARAGVSGDPDQFYFGGHAETAPLVGSLTFRPNVEIGLGDDTTVVAFNVEFAYHFATSRAWNIYAGGGPALNLVRFADDTDPGG